MKLTTVRICTTHMMITLGQRWDCPGYDPDQDDCEVALFALLPLEDD